MRSYWQITFLACVATFLPVSAAFAESRKKDENIKPVSFPTHDGATISGTLYKNSTGKRDAVVILLHDFNDKGGKSTADNLPELAQQLYGDGYSVLTFDFRGYGDSRDVGERFWTKYPDNLKLIKGVKIVDQDFPTTIDHRNFQDRYYIYLINDIAAAKAYLDRASDRKEVNSHNTILLGVGQGATLGALWVANEAHRHKDKRGKNTTEVRPQIDDEPEARDIAACVWLGFGTRLGRRDLGKTARLHLGDVAATQKIPMAFYYGSKDANDDRQANSIARYLNGKTEDIARAREVEGASNCDELLADRKTRKRILDDLDKVLEGRTRENTPHESEDHAFVYLSPRRATIQLRPAVNKRTSDAVDWVDLRRMLLLP